MDRFNVSRMYPFKENSTVRSVRQPSSGNAVAPTPARVSSEHAWANANRAWMTACRLAASRR